MVTGGQDGGDERSKRWLSVQTLPEQIADQLGASIARGEYAAGQRLLEVDVAGQFGVSRGPVREALRILGQRGLVELSPRRGASVIEISVDRLIDLFNIRSALMGLATRYFAAMASDAARSRLEQAIERVQEAASSDATDQGSYLRQIARVNHILATECASSALTKLVEDESYSVAWSSLWTSGRLGFKDRARRLESAAMYRQLGDAVLARDGAEAEATLRRMHRHSLDLAVQAMGRDRPDSCDLRRVG